MSLRRLKPKTIDLYPLHRIDAKVPREEPFGSLADLREEDKVRHVGLSVATIEEIEAVRKQVPIVTVQNLYNLANRQSEDALNYREREEIGFIPWFPVGWLLK